MEMQMEMIRKLPTPQEIKDEYPLRADLKELKEKRDQEIFDIFTGKDDRLLLIIGPCSADNEDSVLDYMNRLVRSPVHLHYLQEITKNDVTRKVLLQT